MKVKIGKNKYIIASDSRQYMLGTYTGRKDKDGNDVIEYIGYYRTIDVLLRELLQTEARLSSANSLDKYLEDVQKVQKKIEKIAMEMAKLIDKEKEFKEKLNA